MGKKLFHLFLLTITMSLLSCTSSTIQEAPSVPTNSKSQSSLTVPNNLLSCPNELVTGTLSSEAEKECATTNKGQFCSYFQSEKDGVVEFGNLQFVNECTLCSAHGQKDATFTKSNGETYKHLGYEKGPCYQGIYEKTN